MKKFNLFCFFILLVGLSTNVDGQKTWTGSVDTMWSNPNNWSPVGVPASGQDITIPNTPNQPTSTTGLVINANDTLTVDSGAMLSILPNFAAGDGLRVAGVVVNHGTIKCYKLDGDGIEITPSGIMNNMQNGLLEIDSTADAGMFIRSGGHVNNWGDIEVYDSDFSGFELYGGLENYANVVLMNMFNEILYLDVDFEFFNYGHVQLGNSSVNAAIYTSNSVMTSFENNGCGIIEVTANDAIFDVGDAIENNSIIIDRNSGTSIIETNNGVIQNLNGGGISIGTNNGTITTQTFDDISKTVLTTNDDNGGSLRRVIECASSGDMIKFGSNLDDQALQITSDSILLDKNLTFMVTQGDSITADAHQIERLFHLPDGGTCVIDGLSMISGTADWGGVFVNKGNLTLRNLSIIQNPSPGAGSRILGLGNGEYLLEENVKWQE